MTYTTTTNKKNKKTAETIIDNKNKYNTIQNSGNNI